MDTNYGFHPKFIEMDVAKFYCNHLKQQQQLGKILLRYKRIYMFKVTKKVIFHRENGSLSHIFLLLTAFMNNSITSFFPFLYMIPMSIHSITVSCPNPTSVYTASCRASLWSELMYLLWQCQWNMHRDELLLHLPIFRILRYITALKVFK